MAGAKVRGRRGRRGSEAVDDHVGQRLRDRRRSLGLSQAQLAARLGFTPAQINRYEHGTTRLSAAGLWHAAEALDVPPGYFFEGLGGQPTRPPDHDLEARALQLARYLRRLDPAIQEKLVGFIASLIRD